MTKLSNLKPRLGSLSTRIGQAPTDEKARDHYRNDSQPWRAWYKTARWQKLRAFVLKRDFYTCQRTGVLLTGRHPAPNSPVVDHIKPHRGDPELFWDEANLMTVSKAYHDTVKQAEEQSEIKGVWY
ncbi:HNH endonuclease [Chelativorans sp. J32]|uniref:HNH endonuclease n=1 Tax=Chelativorans sp. J32 TaxID=935840 RepID=UPI00048851A9|nr:HNH endonuclease [Chelativorans sp. J32]